MLLMLIIHTMLATTQLDVIAQAARLHRSGDLSDAEFTALKARVIYGAPLPERVAYRHVNGLDGYRFVRNGPCRQPGRQWKDKAMPLCLARMAHWNENINLYQKLNGATTQDCASACDKLYLCQAFELDGCTDDVSDCRGACFLFFKGADELHEDEQTTRTQLCYARNLTRPRLRPETSNADKCATLEDASGWPDPTAFFFALRPFVHAVPGSRSRAVVFTTVTVVRRLTRRSWACCAVCSTRARGWG